MKRIFITEDLCKLAKTYAKDLFKIRRSNFEHPLSRLTKLESTLRVKYPKHADYVKVIIRKYLILQCVTPDLFDGINTTYFNMLTPAELSEKVINNTEFYKLVVAAMRYDAVRSFEFLPYVKALGIKACVYCNSQYAITTTIDNKYGGYYELDHFMPKSLYPFLSTSFFNFQPSCSSCNRHKSKKKAEFNLYTKNITELDPFNFHVAPMSIIEYMLYKDNVNIKLLFGCNNKKLLENHEAIFNISSLYENHTDVAEEIICKSIVYNYSYIKSLMFGTFKNNFTHMSFNRFIIGNYDKTSDIHKRPLSKLQQDIARQLKLIK